MSEEQKTITSVSLEDRVFDVPAGFAEKAHVKSIDEYRKLHTESMEDMEGFWAKHAEAVDWFKKWDKVCEYDFVNANVKWFEGGKLNVSYNCLDRHLGTERENKAAIIWEGEPEEDSHTYSYRELHTEVCKFANVLKDLGVKKGDRVCLYLPMIPELAIAMLACTRIGAIHSIVFGGFSSDSLKDRILDCGSTFLITSDGSLRSGKKIPLKGNADLALQECPDVKTVVVVKRTGGDVEWVEGRDIWWHEQMENASADCEPEWMDAEDPLFILYTSGSTGKPKGVLHTTGGYLTYVTVTFKNIFDYRDEDIYWCTADIGWVTGHSYIVYGPLSNGASSLMFEGVPTYPGPDRFWAVVEKYKVNIFYTAPTAIRAVAKEGNDWVTKHDLSSLRLLGTVGEPINPEAWIWYHDIVGGGRCPIVDTWWQTETGGILIAPFPGATPIKPGSATVPFFGVDAAILREDGSEADVNEGGYLVIRRPWPGMMRTVYGEHDRFKETYFIQYPGNYFTGDGARKDADGYFWLMGRIDDVINVSGHRMGTAEVESALVAHPTVAESAVVPMPHDIKGQGIYAFVTLTADIEPSEEMRVELVKHVRTEIGPIATPDKIQFSNALPKTRSGKIMRRILRKIAEGSEELGDITTLADPAVVDSLLKNRET